MLKECNHSRTIGIKIKRKLIQLCLKCNEVTKVRKIDNYNVLKPTCK